MSGIIALTGATGFIGSALAYRLSEAGFHPKRQEKVYLVQFDQWEQPIAVPATNMVLTEEPDEEGS